MNLLTIIQTLLAIFPIIKELLDLIIKTPQQKRDQLISDIHSAIKRAKESGGDTSEIENIIKKGRT